MSKYAQFIFKSYKFDHTTGTLTLSYSYDNVLNLQETFGFNFPFVNYDPIALDRAFQLLFFLAGVSYYKMYVAPEISVESGEIDKPLAEFLNKTYQKGLGEFFFKNDLDPLTSISFPTNVRELEPIAARTQQGYLIGLGGGKDSIVSAELLRHQPRVATWSVNHRSQLEPLVDRIGLPHYFVEREWDPQIASLNTTDAFNGHVPISAIFSCIGSVLALLAGYSDTVVSNESSASEETLKYLGVSINHQYSKSLEYEQDFQAVQERIFGNSLRYYSLLRPLTELRIAELFAKSYFEKYMDVFSSCNRAYTHAQDEMFWCGECAKCSFVFLILTPFVAREKLEELWHEKNLLLDPTLEPMYNQLLGIEGDKPFDCVGEVKESRSAMRKAQKIYPELAKYIFDLPGDYDYKAWGDSRMPVHLLELIRSEVN